MPNGFDISTPTGMALYEHDRLGNGTPEWANAAKIREALRVVCGKEIMEKVEKCGGFYVRNATETELRARQIKKSITHRHGSGVPHVVLDGHYWTAFAAIMGVSQDVRVVTCEDALNPSKAAFENDSVNFTTEPWYVPEAFQNVADDGVRYWKRSLDPCPPGKLPQVGGTRIDELERSYPRATTQLFAVQDRIKRVGKCANYWYIEAMEAEDALTDMAERLAKEKMRREVAEGHVTHWRGEARRLRFWNNLYFWASVGLAISNIILAAAL